MPAMTGLVLCGGGSRRMGTDKALLLVDGVPLVRRVAERMAAVADPVLLATGRKGRLGSLPYREVEDPIDDAGPLAGLVAGLRASPHPLVAAVAVDMPFASGALLAHLAGQHAGEDAVVPVTERGPEPLHAVYATTAMPTLQQALDQGQYKLLDLIARLRTRLVAASEWRPLEPGGHFALNVNTPEDLSRLGRGTAPPPD